MVRPVSCFVISTNSKNTQLIFNAILVTRTHYPFNPYLLSLFLCCLTPFSLSISFFLYLLYSHCLLPFLCHTHCQKSRIHFANLSRFMYHVPSHIYTPQPRPQPNCPAFPLRKSHPLHQQKKNCKLKHICKYNLSLGIFICILHRLE